MLRFSTIVLAFATLTMPAGAQSWPSARPIRMIAPFPPASTVDVVARILGQQLTKRLGTQVVVDNRPGASGNLGADAIAKAPPDGYTIGIVTNSTQAVAVTLSSNLPYNPLKDFTPITMVANTPYVLVLYPKLPALTVPELISLAKSKPGALTYGSAGTASLAHLAGALFGTLTGVQMTHVPYRSSAQSVVDIISGRLDMQFSTIAPTLTNIQAGQMRALATTGLTRSPALPDVPTIDEIGVKGYEATLWFALVAPAGLPPAINERLHRDSIDALNSAEVKQSLEQQGFVADPGTPESLMSKIRDDIVKWRDVIAKAGIKSE